MAAIVYLATNRINGKRYIGATSKTLDLRRRGHLYQAKSGLRGCTRFYAAIRKHGSEAFEWSELRNCATFEEALIEERKLIAEIRPEYNLRPGGQGHCSSPAKPRGPQSPDVIKKRADANRGKVPTAEHREKIRKALKGRKRPPEVVAKILASRAARYSEKPWIDLGLTYSGWSQRRRRERRAANGGV
jgi:group I intron endonuclease